jgi:hypothetical protein
MLEDADAKAFDIVLVAAVDRLGRQLENSRRIATVLASSAVELHSASKGQNVTLAGSLCCGDETSSKLSAAVLRRRRAARRQWIAVAAGVTSSIGRETP